jgi:hypothetical protein
MQPNLEAHLVAAAHPSIKALLLIPTILGRVRTPLRRSVPVGLTSI